MEKQNLSFRHLYEKWDQGQNKKFCEIDEQLDGLENKFKELLKEKNFHDLMDFRTRYSEVREVNDNYFSMVDDLIKVEKAFMDIRQKIGSFSWSHQSYINTIANLEYEQREG